MFQEQPGFCLNCHSELHGKYCAHCGQKASTKRIKFKYFLTDILGRVIQLERGMLFTIKEILLRPGKSALDYISGKRIAYVNIFLMTLFALGVFVLAVKYDFKLRSWYGEEAPELETNEAGELIVNFFKANFRYVIVSFIPAFGLSSIIFFRRKKLNYSEHAVLSAFTLLGVFILLVVNIVVGYTEPFIGTEVYYWISNIFGILLPCYIIYAYYNAFGKDYTIMGFSWRMLLFMSLNFILIVWVIAMFWIIATNFSSPEVKIHFK